MPPVSENIFRKVALERLSSPEQLDRLITLSSPIGWAALAALAALLAAVVAWGIFGGVPTRVEGAGILVTRDGHVFRHTDDSRKHGHKSPQGRCRRQSRQHSGRSGSRACAQCAA